MFKNFELTKKTGCREIPRFYFCITGSFQLMQVPCQSGENGGEISIKRFKKVFQKKSSKCLQIQKNVVSLQVDNTTRHYENKDKISKQGEYLRDLFLLYALLWWREIRQLR